MSNNFGSIDIILLAMIAGFIILRLRNILGRKTGHQDKVFSGFEEKRTRILRIRIRIIKLILKQSFPEILKKKIF